MTFDKIKNKIYEIIIMNHKKIKNRKLLDFLKKKIRIRIWTNINLMFLYFLGIIKI